MMPLRHSRQQHYHLASSGSPQANPEQFWRPTTSSVTSSRMHPPRTNGRRQPLTTPSPPKPANQSFDAEPIYCEIGKTDDVTLRKATTNHHVDYNCISNLTNQRRHQPPVQPRLGRRAITQLDMKARPRPQGQNYIPRRFDSRSDVNAAPPALPQRHFEQVSSKVGCNYNPLNAPTYLPWVVYNMTRFRSTQKQLMFSLLFSSFLLPQ